jgi:uncharacterized membrane protein
MSEKALKFINIAVPILGIGLMVLYESCDTSCSYLKGTFLGIDLKMIGILFMAVALALNITLIERSTLVNRLRTAMFAGALGGETLLVRFQVVNDTYCPFCMAFGACILLLFGANFMRMEKYLALGAFISGIAAFAFLFKGSILPLY